MSVDEGLYAWVEECLGGMSPGHPSDARGASRPKHLEPLGRVSMRKMMGGATLYLDGTVFAIMDEGELWFKADEETNAAWDAQGCDRFTVAFKDGRVETMNYRRAPADVYDDPEAMQRWAQLALAAGLRGAAKKKPKRPKPRS
ncbi:MAG: TfoX/Sxy family protein [Pseudomonadota bacterium]|nr:TfoX/Sxy family protein [Pseudomonadota bacterium]